MQETLKQEIDMSRLSPASQPKVVSAKRVGRDGKLPRPPKPATLVGKLSDFESELLTAWRMG